MNNQVRVNALKLLHESCASTTQLNERQLFQIARVLECSVYDWTRTQCEDRHSDSYQHWHQYYTKKVLQLEWALRINNNLLDSSVPASSIEQLVYLSSSQLAAGTPLQAKFDNLLNSDDAVHVQIESELDNIQNIVIPASTSTGALCCSKCYSNNIALEQKQTRGADESMTIFCECQQCGKRWKM